MKKFLILLAFLTGCATTNHDVLPKPEPVAEVAKPAPAYKYRPGDCVRFNAKKMAAKGLKSDGTIMFILGVKRADPKVNKPELYVALIKHKRIKEPTEFTAFVKVFDRDTDKVACPK